MGFSTMLVADEYIQIIPVHLSSAIRAGLIKQSNKHITSTALTLPASVEKSRTKEELDTIICW